MRVLISGGGTGGHANPAIAIANYIREKDKNVQIAFAGTEKGIENILVPKEGYKLYHLKVKGFKRKFSLQNIDALIKAVTSQITAKKIIKEYRPDVVIGTGGFVSYPVLAVAAKLKIPTVIQELNAIPGVTTKMLAKNVDKIMINFEDSRKYFGDNEKPKLIYTGTPVKSDFFNVNHREAKSELSPNRPMIMSYAGSMGAEGINEVIMDFMEKYSKNKNVNHYHATGTRDFKESEKVFNQKKLNTYKNLFLSEYFFGIAKYMAAADIVICRAGASTLAELSVIKKAAILIPSPYVAENHQYNNAIVLERDNAAIVIEEKDLTADLLIEKVDELLNDPFEITKMSQNISHFATPDTLEKMYKIIMNVKNGDTGV